MPERIVRATHTLAHRLRDQPMSVSRVVEHKLKVKLSRETFQFKFNFQRSSSIIIVFTADTVSPVVPVFTQLIFIPDSGRSGKCYLSSTEKHF